MQQKCLAQEYEIIHFIKREKRGTCAKIKTNIILTIQIWWNIIRIYMTYRQLKVLSVAYLK